MHQRSSLAWAAIDTLSALLLVIYALVAPTVPKVKPHIRTYGVMAITLTWSTPDDLDLYVRDPNGEIVYFASQRAGLMYLENDSIPRVTDATRHAGRTIRLRGPHRERTILTGLIPGEYQVDVQVYRKAQASPSVATVRLFSLRGEDRLLHVQRLTLGMEGQEETAFRFTPTAHGAGGYNRLKRPLVGFSPEILPG